MLTAGLDLGGTKVLGALVDADGTVVAQERRSSRPDDAHELVAGLTDLIAALSGDRDVGAVGIGAAGMVDGEGVVRYAPNVPAFVDFPLRQRVADATGLPVVVENDANAAAWGEVAHGAARGRSDVLVITLGTGIGGGIVTGGSLYRGARGYAAELGHFQVTPDGPRCACGEVGHWEAVGSGTALGRMGQEAAARGRLSRAVELAGGDPDAVTGVHVGDAAQEGDREATELVAEYAGWVAIGLAGLANILDPEMIVIGGGLVELGDTLLEPVRESFRDRVEAADRREVIEIVPAALGERAGAVGAAALARRGADG